MKWFIASDIHGSAYYARKMLEAFDREQCERLMLLGDLLYHGPRNDLPRDYAPKQVIAMLNERKDLVFCVRGNCEAEVDQLVLDFPVMADYALFPIQNRVMFITHGHTFNQNHVPPHKPGDILLHGHTHIPACVQCEDYMYLNPGSVSLPKENNPHSYMILEDGHFLWKTLNNEMMMEWSIL